MENNKMRKSTKKIRKKIEKKNIDVKDFEVSELKKVKNRAKLLTDTRMKKKTIYKIWDIVMVVFLATICNCNDWGDIYLFAIMNKEWLRSFLQLTGGIPTETTYKNVMAIIKPCELHDFCMYAYDELISKARKKGDIYHFDGKVDVGSARKTNKDNEKIKPLNVMNVYSEETGLCIEQEMIEDKTNEIPTMPNIIKRLNMEGVIATADALNTQISTAEAIIDGKGDYVLALKGNQEDLYTNVVEYLDIDKLMIIESGYEGGYSLTRENSHGKIITYQYYQTEKIDWYDRKEKWKGLKSIGLVVKTTEDKEGKKVVEKRYYISSLLLDIQLFSRAIRSHWSVENKLHWQLDFTFKCDENGTVNKSALYNLQILKKNAMGILRLVKEDYNLSMKKIRFVALQAPEREIPKIFYLAKKKGWNFDIVKA